MATFDVNTFTIHDDYMTPKSAWEAIVEYIPKGKIIWEAFYGNGDSGRYLTELGFNVIHENIDFFKEDHGEIIVSNPPFSIKKSVIQRLYKLNKPFILIMPVSTLCTNYIKNLFGDTIQLIIPAKRIQFAKLSDGILKTDGRCSFECCYYCYKIGLDRDITFL
jgi:hypothetical protein